MAKALSLTQIRKNAAAFTRDWKDAPGDERQEAQTFVRELLKVYGITSYKAAYYEKRVKRVSTGGQGYIDALIPGLALIEMKSAGKDLVAAEQQALDYIENLETAEEPRYVITSDFRRFRILDLLAEDDDVTEFTLDEFRDQADKLAFFAGYGQRQFGSKEQEKASIKAAKLMASLYEALEGSGFDDHEASVFLVRTLFALYADDAGMWERDLFLEFLETRTNEDGSDLGPQLSALYQALSREPSRRMKHLDEIIQRFPYVNGSIFEETIAIPAFDREMRERLLDAAKFNWSEISPAIFGSLFQAVKDKTARRELGEHYTTETNIMKVIGPMFLDELHQRYRDGLHDTKALTKLRADMGRMQFFDPACGCGNFLVVAYREMRSLDLDIALRLRELADTSRGSTNDQLLFVEEDLPVHLSNFHGLELEEWPARIAATALHLVEHQANQAMELKLGQAPEPLPLNKINTIHVGNALQVNWAEIAAPSETLYVMGNPPFIGHKSKSTEQRDELRVVWGSDFDGYFDYVSGWFKKAADFFGDVRGQFAFVSTNSIVQGQTVAAMFRPLEQRGWRINFAHRTFAWTSEAPSAASVHCVVVGMSRKKVSAPVLFDYDSPRADPTRVPALENINAYLVDAPDAWVSSSEVSIGHLPEPSYGTMPADGGNLLINTREQYDTAISDPIAAKYVRKFVGAKELVHGTDRWCLWLEAVDPSDLTRSPFLKERVTACRDWRSEQKVTGDAYKLRETPHLFRPNAKRPKVKYVCIPRHVTENRKFFAAAHFDPEVISGDANFTAADPDGLAFAVISSSAFIAWQRAVGGRIKSDLRFSKTLTWNTFPLPALSDAQRAAIIAGGEAVLEARELHPGRSLADHYNPLAMDPALLKAHRQLDKAIDGALGLRGTPDEDARLAALFKHYEKLTTEAQLAMPTSRSRRRA